MWIERVLDAHFREIDARAILRPSDAFLGGGRGHLLSEDEPVAPGEAGGGAL